MATLITGASAGLGAALALTYAQPGTYLALGGRNAEALRQTADLCRSRGATVSCCLADVRDTAKMAEWIHRIDAETPLQLVIANAGISRGTSGNDPADTREIFAVNLDGVINTVLPALDGMRQRGRGQIALVSSLYGRFPKGDMPAYSASKAAVRIWALTLRRHLAGSGISVNVITPGFLRTRLTSGMAARLLPTDEAAAIIKAALQRDEGEISFPLRQQVLLQLKEMARPIATRAVRRLRLHTTSFLVMCPHVPLPDL